MVGKPFYHNTQPRHGVIRSYPIPQEEAEIHYGTVGRILRKLKLELPYDLAVPLVGIYPEDEN